MSREKSVIHDLDQAIRTNGYQVVTQNNNNYGYPYVYERQGHRLHCRFVDSVFLQNPEAWVDSKIIVTDNHLLKPTSAQVISVLPEFWHLWHFEPVYKEREPHWAFNCFMNRARGDRSRTWYELIHRNLLSRGLVSFNLDLESYQQQYAQANLNDYDREHEQGRHMIPYNNLTGTLEQCIIDSNVSLILETYVSDDHVVFSEKTFRCLQMPRPWLLYCSPGAVGLLRDYGFDVLDDVVDHHYDGVINHVDRLQALLDQLENFANKKYEARDYQRFRHAVAHNQKLLIDLGQQWPDRLARTIEKINQL